MKAAVEQQGAARLGEKPGGAVGPRTPRGVATRARLFEAARSELIERHGRLEVESVARRAGVSVGLIYRHFGSKAGLVSAVVQAFYKRFEDEVISSNPAPGAEWAAREHRRTVRAVAFHYEDPLAPVVLSRLHLDPAVAAHAVIGMLIQVLHWWTQDPSRAPREVVIDTVTGLRLSGLHAKNFEGDVTA